jgi:tripartite-type tricarboxylate transporter receptor subunit TctC
MHWNKLLAALAVAISLSANASPVLRIVVPYPPGGPADFIARLIQPILATELNRQVQVENRPGASGDIGTVVVANAPASETVLLINTVGVVINTISPDAAYNEQQLIPLINFGKIPMVLVMSAKSKVVSYKQLAALDEMYPLTFASSGPRTATGMYNKEFKQVSKKNIISVGYKGVGQAWADILSSNIDGGFFYYTQATPFLDKGKIFVLGVDWPSRVPQLNKVPTFDELGIKGINHHNWWVLLSNKSSNKDEMLQIQDVIARMLSVNSNQFDTIGLYTEKSQIIPASDFLSQERHKYIKLFD